MKALITGIGGFVGGHLARYLLSQPDTQVVGAVLFSPDRHPDLQALGLDLHQIDLTDERAVIELIAKTHPDQIYHLAGQSFVPESFENPWETLRNNIQSQLNVLQALANLNYDTRVLVVGSGETYGAVPPDKMPVGENHPLRPSSPYSVSKVAQDMLGLQYFLSHNVQTVRVRPFNQIGPGQSERFAAPSFASQIAAIEKGGTPPVISVGNLEARRDFTDVRDMVRAYHALLERGQPGEVYNIGTGRAYSIDEVLHLLLGMSPERIEIKIDPARVRPVEIPVMLCDPTKIRDAIGWRPIYTLEQTLADLLSEWRERLGVPAHQ